MLLLMFFKHVSFLDWVNDRFRKGNSIRCYHFESFYLPVNLFQIFKYLPKILGETRILHYYEFVDTLLL